MIPNPEPGPRNRPEGKAPGAFPAMQSVVEKFPPAPHTLSAAATPL
jgi:hypothetical protein